MTPIKIKQHMQSRAWGPSALADALAEHGLGGTRENTRRLIRRWLTGQRSPGPQYAAALKTIFGD